MQLLILGNDENTIKWVSEQTAFAGCNHFEVYASTVAEVESLYKSLHFDAVLYNVFIPENYSKETVKALAAVCIETPFIILTEIFTLPFAVEAVEFGADTYLLKSKSSAKLLMDCLKIIIPKKKESARHYNLSMYPDNI